MVDAVFASPFTWSHANHKKIYTHTPFKSYNRKTGDVFLAGTVNNLNSVLWIPMVMAWVNGCIATELKDARKWYLFLNGNDISFPRTNITVCCSTVTKLNICPDQICRDQIWYSGTLPISKTTHELKFNRLVGLMWAKQIYCTISYENGWCIFSQPVEDSSGIV